MATAAYHFDAATHTYYNALGKPVPSVTQILKASGWINYDHIPAHILEHAAHRGKLVHQACHFYDADALQPEETLPEEVLVRLRGYKKFRSDSGYLPLVNEHQQVATLNGMHYGMQLDSTGVVGKVPWIIDIKNGAVVQPGWGIQLAAYDLGAGRPLPYLRRERYVVQLIDNGYRLHKFDDPADYDEWHRILASTIMKLNKKVPLFKDRVKDAAEAWAA